jgi:hypothetical protein
MPVGHHYPDVIELYKHFISLPENKKQAFLHELLSTAFAGREEIVVRDPQGRIYCILTFVQTDAMRDSSETPPIGDPPDPSAEVSPLMVYSQEAFRRELPKLLELHAEGEWAAYRGSERLRVGPSKDDLYNECLKKGLKRGEFLVRLIDRSNRFESEFIDMSRDL